MTPINLRRPLSVFCLLFLIFTISFTAQAQSASTQLNSNLLSEFKWRLIGPSSPAGRVWQVVGDENDPKTFYVCTAGGGLWKSTDNGTTLVPIFDNQASASTGAVAIAKANSKLVWVGTGEPANTRANSWGDGVYKSLDGGKTWSHMGLGESRQISAIVIHPTKPDTVYVAAMGYEWGRNSERGIFKTVDGGKSWTKVLFINDTTGFVDLQADPKNPDVLYAAAWQRFRFGGGDMAESGPGSRIYKTTDGGKKWLKLTYLGSNYLFRFTERGEKWEIISPDLTAQQEKDLKGNKQGYTGYHSYGALFSIAESPLD